MKTSVTAKHAQICSNFFSALADTPHIPLLRAPLKCRWQADPVSGVLAARWLDTSQELNAGASIEDNAKAPRYGDLQ
jgi:hypothetical protein